MNLDKHCTSAGLQTVDRPTGDMAQTAEDQACTLLAWPRWNRAIADRSFISTPMGTGGCCDRTTPPSQITLTCRSLAVSTNQWQSIEETTGLLEK